MGAAVVTAISCPYVEVRSLGCLCKRKRKDSNSPWRRIPEQSEENHTPDAAEPKEACATIDGLEAF